VTFKMLTLNALSILKKSELFFTQTVNHCIHSPRVTRTNTDGETEKRRMRLCSNFSLCLANLSVNIRGWKTMLFQF